ncbi:alpha/beta fold hydrolase [Stackebrandtia soli]|uniref:alpha/beta fold hydrolase n=1 Tax=Stackebrandtia soli TaxID=1892856 RepID=UPI0039E7943D
MTRPTLVRGGGDPVTVFAHGFGGGIADTRPYASGVDGTKVFYTARAHDGIPVDEFGYGPLAEDLRNVADAASATRAFGVSMGAGALTHLLEHTPQRFDRLVFFLPAVLDVPRGEAARAVLASLREAIAADDHAALTDAILAEIPESVRGTPSATAYARIRAETLLMPSLAGLIEILAEQVAVTDLSSLSRVSAPALVIACTDDAAHPEAVARQLAETLPEGRLEILGGTDAVWTRRDRLRALISEFLNEDDTL